MLAEQIELANMNEENPFQPHETTAAPQEELLVVNKKEEGDSDINVLYYTCYLIHYISLKNIFFALKIIITFSCKK